MAGGTRGTGGLRVALVCPYSLSRPGGVQGQVLGLARCLADRGHSVTVFAPVDGRRRPAEGVELVATGHSTALPANGSVAPVSVSPRAARRALRELRARTPDVVHVHEPFAPGMTYALLAARGVPPIVATFHRSGGSALYTLLRPLARAWPVTWRSAAAVSDAAAATAPTRSGGATRSCSTASRSTGSSGWPRGRRPGRPCCSSAVTRSERGWGSCSRPGGSLPMPATRSAVPAPAAAPAATREATPESPTVPRTLPWPPRVLGRRGHPCSGWRATVPRRRPFDVATPESESVRWLGVVDEEEKIRRLVGADVVAAPALGGESFGLVLLEGYGRTGRRGGERHRRLSGCGGRPGGPRPPGDAPALATALRGVLDGRLARGADGDDDGDDEGSSRAAWLDAGAERAGQWSMATLAQRYEDLYRGAVVGRLP